MQNTALWLASIFGPTLVILGLWKLLYSDSFLKVLNSVKISAGLLYYSSVAYIWVGLTVLSQYDMWDMTSFVFVTILGWFMVARGILGLFAPQLLIDMYFKRPGCAKICGLISLAWGIVLSWIAFFMM